MPFADLHLHPTMPGYQRLAPGSLLPGPWDVPQELREVRGGRATRYAQCSFPSLSRAGCRLVFASITPIERGFLAGGEGAPRHRFVPELARWLSGATPALAARAALKGDRQGAARQLARILRNRGPLRVALQRRFLGYPPARLRFMASRAYDYWDDFGAEYAWLCSADGQVASFDGGQGRYDVIRGANHLRETLTHNDGRLAVILTIEGAHTFSIGTDDQRVPRDVIEARIQALLDLPHPILFLTLAHHFDNGLCGHARSLIDAGTLLMDQSRRLGAGIEREDGLGMWVIRRLLGLSEDLRDLGGRRILIDAKHMSPRSRAEYYAEVVRPHRARGGGRPIPVIFSHAGYSGVATLARLIADEGRETDRWNAGGYYAWGINLAAEDVHEVHASGGLIGLCLDRRIAGIAAGQRVGRGQHARALLTQILGIVDAVYADDRIPAAHKPSIWNCIAIGSDYDGAINPLGAYKTAESLPQLRDDLRGMLHEWRHTRGIADIGVDELVERIVWRNALEFAQRHLPV